MKAIIAAVLFLVLGFAAQAKLAPVDAVPVAGLPDDLTASTERAGATLEQDYFRAPQPASAGSRVFPCRLQLRVFDKTRLAQSCN